MTGSSMLDQAMNLRRIRLIKNILLIVIAIVMIILIAVSMVHKGLSANPFFLPFPAILFTVIMAGMLMSIVSIVFNGVEVITGDSPGRRFLAAQHGRKVSMWTGIIVLILTILFVVILVIFPVFEDAISTDQRWEEEGTTIPFHEFVLVDSFDASRAERIVIEVIEGAPIKYIISTKDPTSGKYNDKETGRVEAGERLVIDLAGWPKEEYKVEMEPLTTPAEQDSTWTYNLDRKLNPELITALTGFLGAIAVANLVWVVITHILMKRYEVESVGGLATMMPLDEEY